jgi:hypothetical protein
LSCFHGGAVLWLVIVSVLTYMSDVITKH